MSSSSEQPPKSTRPTEENSVDLDPQVVPDQQSNTPQDETHGDGMQLKGPPRRPVAKTPPPQTPVVVSVHKQTPMAETVTSDEPEPVGQQPIPPPSEPMQYRAIGLIKGKYKPSEEQFNRGELVTEDGTYLDAVLLGQVMSLVKKYLELDQTYLWVVYPRTREKEETLHMQIVGVWSTEGFGPMAAVAEATEVPEPPSQLAAPLQDGYFSIRGEIVFQSTDRNYLLVKIQQSPRKSSDRPKAFKLKLLGTLKDKTLGYFWDLHVQRQGGELTIVNGQKVALVPPKRKSKTDRSDSHKPNRFGSSRPHPTESKPRPVGKPIIKRRSSPEA